MILISLTYDTFLCRSLFLRTNQCLCIHLFQPWNLFKSYPFYMIIVVDKWHKWRGCHQEQMVSDKKAPLEITLKVTALICYPKFHSQDLISVFFWNFFAIKESCFSSLRLVFFQKHPQQILFLSHQTELWAKK